MPNTIATSDHNSSTLTLDIAILQITYQLLTMRRYYKYDNEVYVTFRIEWARIICFLKRFLVSYRYD